MKLRNATKDDLLAILKLHDVLFDYKYTYDNYLIELDNEISDFMVLENNGIIIGYFITHTAFEQLEIVIIAIANEYQRLGYGKFFLQYIDYLKNKRAATEILIEVSIFNEVAINFYQKNGFKYLTQRDDYYNKGNHALVYRK
ncbi:GNAT family N-acetyltransferase [Erysipelotrichaceae bacterium OttesenSCG-928-M19]|nr:GNAT family N-acetyltransferase [Erysipelotrichaceae bacterium OttesenSCG-928-M19]